MNFQRIWFQTGTILLIFHQMHSLEGDYLQYVKHGCFSKRETLACLKYKALKITTKTLFGEKGNRNDTIKVNNVLSFVPVAQETIRNYSVEQNKYNFETRSIVSEWSELTKYIMELFQDFLKVKGLRIDLPRDASAIEEDDTEIDDGRGRKKKLAIIIPLLTLLTSFKTKLMLVPVLLAVLLIKKLLLAAAFLLPTVLSTLKHCKQHHSMPHYSYVGSESSDFSSDYGNSYSYSSGGGYGKDWPANRVYTLPKYRPSPTTSYVTSPGSLT